MGERRPLQETSFMSRSQISIGRFSERELHRDYMVNDSGTKGLLQFCALETKECGSVVFVCSCVVCLLGGCDACLTRIPYATLIATIMCALGVVVFCATMYRGATLAILMFDQVFKMRILWYVLLNLKITLFVSINNLFI